MNITENRVFVRPGFGKSGTTTFQNDFFGKLGIRSLHHIIVCR